MPYRCRKDGHDLTRLVLDAFGERGGHEVPGLVADGDAAPKARIRVACPKDDVVNVFVIAGAETRQVIIGSAPTAADAALSEASSDLLDTRDQRGRETATALLGQVAVVATFLGGFSLLGDEAKEAVTASGWSVAAIAAAAAGLALALASLFVPPWAMPPLDNLTAQQAFWNRRVRNRRLALAASGAALALAIAFATLAYAEGREAVRPEPTATLIGKVTPAGSGPWTVEVSAAWAGLARGERVLTCVEDLAGAVLGRLDATANEKGATSSTVAMPLPGVARTLTVTSYRVAAGARLPAATDRCALLPAARAGEPARLVLNLR